MRGPTLCTSCSSSCEKGDQLEGAGEDDPLFKGFATTTPVLETCSDVTLAVDDDLRKTIDRVDLAHVRKLNSAYIEEVQRARVDPLEINLAHAYVVYGPKNDKTDRLIAKLRKDTHNNTIPDDDNYDDLQSYRDTAHEERSSEPSNLVSHDTDESDDSDDDDLNYMHPVATSSHHHGYGYQRWSE
ncbi:hypothetical protein HPB51_015239 [Rhipicephalus microplus]|uniref:Uncharacterized protein n=1 Tax=Rhipicephalus microplus TaxID=6941 RepID=A0A9J6DNW2_RHIMP|nr:hypothetical protein HPB51_015239 [Rhipicephalus microplus]